ncbi:hypothetical protein [Streptomyces sp. NPDC015345]|uniref:hypothetical protein n=1 Tax=Streptomyces sp. NPDC015345 TaxID=3364953 RepID=UPI0036FB0A20
MSDPASELHVLCVSVDAASRAFSQVMESAARALYAGVPAATVEALLRSLRTGNPSSHGATELSSPTETTHDDARAGAEDDGARLLPPPLPSQVRESLTASVSEMVKHDPGTRGKQVALQLGVSESTAHRLLKKVRVSVLVDLVARNPRLTVEDVAAHFGDLDVQHIEQLVKELPNITIPRRQ